MSFVSVGTNPDMGGGSARVLGAGARCHCGECGESACERPLREKMGALTYAPGNDSLFVIFSGIGIFKGKAYTVAVGSFSSAFTAGENQQAHFFKPCCAGCLCIPAKWANKMEVLWREKEKASPTLRSVGGSLRNIPLCY